MKKLPTRMHHKHGRYWYVYKNKWHPLSKDYTVAIKQYADFIQPIQGGLDDLVNRTLNELDVKPSTMRQYRVRAKYIKQAFADFSPSQVTPGDVYDLMQQFRDRPSTANHIRSLLKIVFDNACSWREVSSNPVSPVRPFKRKPRDRYLTDEEYLKIRQNAAKHIQVMMDLAYVTGQRIGDILKLKHSDIQGDTIYFKQEKSNNRLKVTSDGIPEVVQAAKGLRGYQAITLFHIKGRPYGYGGVRDAFRRACVKAGVQDAQFRDIRAKSATDAEEQGLNPTLLLGHSDPKTTKIYLRKRRMMQGTGLKVLRQNQ